MLSGLQNGIQYRSDYFVSWTWMLSILNIRKSMLMIRQYCVGNYNVDRVRPSMRRMDGPGRPGRPSMRHMDGPGRPSRPSMRHMDGLYGRLSLAGKIYSLSMITSNTYVKTKNDQTFGSETITNIPNWDFTNCAAVLRRFMEVGHPR